MNKRSVNVVVMSDLHLGTYGCHATEILQYLKSIAPQILILNGDIIDGWQFSKRYFPTSHLQVIKEIINLVSNGTRVIYITGNHDEMLRRYSDVEMGNFKLTDKVVMEIDGKMTWIFHGDVFDATTKGSAKILAKMGGHGYDLLILLNRFINYFLRLAGREKMSFSKKVKASVKQAVSWIGNFEQTAAELAISKKYDYVICGHIHQPQVRTVETPDGKVVYMNSGDWVENLTALEYNQHEWTVYQYDPKAFIATDLVQLNHITQAPTLNVITDEVSLFLNSLILQP
ncbi:UDP-2,3-diacylglucosamine diphosphatase [Sediminibacterium salmoneum]|uniref:UDP-2,3-diacylglucosamine diphosphatase n=1 Tax=Sediminibacterium salmoneum TaxID=426421 RepID=UPI00047A81D3|nr:UDP-2,3-diacylglucosamine diphosphatase [Sediminibacterium salmoneum]